MKTLDARWMRVRDLFQQAIEMPAERRDAFIESQCGDDLSLRDELKSLVASDREHSKGPLTGAIGAAVDATTRERRQELLGTVIGPYRLTSVLGHGGAGTVYLGERVDRQYSAQVAVKVVEGAALNAEISRRFRAERQILANLNHPNIARLIDAGETPQGFPYLVMEYIHGESIHQYCDREQLGLDDRVELMLKVCSAVHYAHQNLVVHRDLKPGNILVTPDGTPKLLDFGIAKLLDTGAAAAEMALTRLNDRILTPEYASPEQILGQTVNTSSDVYSLGVVLYELLTGLRPYKVSSASQLELERTICITDPSRPSSAVREALSKASAEPPPTRNIYAVAEARRLTPMRLRAQLDGDLDAILMRSLRKEPVHRYSSVEQFAGDLRRHLSGAPVMAREGNWVYYSQRFVRQHVFGVSVTAGFILILAAALVVTSIQAKRIAEQRDAATREKQTSEAVANFMTNVFAAADPFSVQDRQVTAKELLDQAAANIRNDLGQQPAVKARLLEVIGQSYQHQGQLDRSVSLVQEALQLRRQISVKNDPALAATLSSLGKAQIIEQDLNGALKSLEEARNIIEQNSRMEFSEYADVLVDLGRVALLSGKLELAKSHLNDALPILRKEFGDNHFHVAAALTQLGYVLQWQNDYKAMEAVAREAVRILQATRPELHPERLLAEGLLAECFFYQGLIDQAAPLIEQVHEKRRKVFGSESSRILVDLQLMIELRRAQNRPQEAVRYAEEAVQLTARRQGNDNTNTAYARTTFAIILLALDKTAAAEAELRKALAVYRQSLTPTHPYIASAEYFLAESLLAQKRYAEAARQAEANLETLTTAANTPAWRIARTESTLGFALLNLNKTERARDLLERSYSTLSTATGDADKDAITATKRRLEILKARTERSTSRR